LQDNLAKLHVMAEALMKYETIDSEQIDDIMAGKQPRPPDGWDEGDHGGKPQPSGAAAPVVPPAPTPAPAAAKSSSHAEQH